MEKNVLAMDPQLRAALLAAQANEITEHHIYLRLAKAVKEADNSQLLERIAHDELRHYQSWLAQTGQEVEPNWRKVRWFLFLAKALGLTFAIKKMEQGEELAQDVYAKIAQDVPEAREIIEDEGRHERELIEMIDEERLRYIGSTVLGLNDALVELTGTLAGLTLALQNTQLIAMAGLVTGIAASLSMAASEYLSTKSEESEQDPLKAALYTGVAYVFTVVVLILPYFIVPGYLGALAWTLVNAVLVILVFSYYISVAKDLPFKRRFGEMAAISLGVAILSFVIGFAVRQLLGIEV